MTAGAPGSRRAAAGEQGFTLIEVLMAAVMLAVIVSAAAALFVSGADNSLAAQRESQLISVADQQIETIRQQVKTLGFSALAMSAAPAAATNSTLFSSTTHTDANDFVSSGTGSCGSSNQGYAIEKNWDDTSQGPASGVLPWSTCTSTGSTVAEPLQILSGGFVTPGPTTVSVGTDTATVNVYVTDTYVGCLLGSCPTLTAGGAINTASCTWPTTTAASTPCTDARRVIVAVLLHHPSNLHKYQVGQASPVYLSTIFTNPTPSNAPNSAIGITLGLQLG